MKRYFLLLLAVGLLMSILVACTDDPESSSAAPAATTDPITTTTATTTTETPVTTQAKISGALSEEDRAELLSMVEKDTARAYLIGDTTIDKYGSTIMGYKLAETYNISTGRASGSASVWHYTSYYAMISRLVELAQTGSDAFQQYTKLSNRVYDAFKLYEGTADVTTYLGTFEKTMYGVNRANSKGSANIAGDQAVYDDQMWIIRETVYRYKQTGEKAYLDEAMRLAKICIDGWDYTLDEDGNEYGGIPWGPFYSNKHTCSNAPIVAPLVEIYEILAAQEDAGAQYYLDWAIKIYEYTKEKLRNGSGRYGDSTGYSRKEVTTSSGKKYVTVGEGGFDATEYSYNTGAMISGAAALYRATGKSTYLSDAKSTARAAYSGFCKTTAKNGTRVFYYPQNTQTTWFNLVLLQGFLDFYEVADSSFKKTLKSYILSFQNSLDFAYDNYLQDGFLPRDYVNGWNMDSNYDKNKNVMDQASASQIYAMLALWAKEQIAADDALIAAAQS